MPNLQYIGARYVPKFYQNPDTGDITWKSNVGYEPLTVVKYNDDTYTSKIPVPTNVGNPADNPTYWAKTADFNAALQALQVNMGEAQADIAALEITRQINRANARYVLIGDSLGTGTYSGNPDGGWCKYFRNRLGLVEGVNAFTTANNGKGWSTSGTNFLSMAQALTTTDDDTITDVIVLGGLNDYTTDFTDEWNAANTLYTYLHNRFSNAAIRFGVIGRSRDNAAVNTALETDIIPAIKNSYAQYIDGSHLFGRWYDKYMDTWHWSDDYTQVFATLLAANYGAAVHVINDFRPTIFTADAEFSQSNNPIANMRQDETGIIIPEATERLFQYSIDKQFTGAPFIRIPLGTLRSNIAGDGKLILPVTGYIGFSAPTSEFFPYSGYLTFTAGNSGHSDLTLVMGGVFAHDTGYVTRTVHNFIINVPETVVPAEFT